MKERICFNTYGDWENVFKKLDADSCKELITAVFSYGLRRELPPLSPIVDIAIESFLPLMERDWVKYEARAEANRKNGINGRRGKRSPNNPIGSQKTEKTESVILEPNRTERTLINKKEEIINEKVIEEKKYDKKEEYSFERFWELYDKKCGDKTKLRSKWEKLPLKDKVAIFSYIPLYKQSRPQKQYRKDPSTFLNNRTWEDEIITYERFSRTTDEQVMRDTINNIGELRQQENNAGCE